MIFLPSSFKASTSFTVNLSAIGGLPIIRTGPAALSGRGELDAQNVRLMAIGDVDALPYAPRIGIKNTIKKLSRNTGLVLNLALSYSSRQEILGAVKEIASKAKDGSLSPEEIDENFFRRFNQIAIHQGLKSPGTVYSR